MEPTTLDLRLTDTPCTLLLSVSLSMSITQQQQLLLNLRIPAANPHSPEATTKRIDSQPSMCGPQVYEPKSGTIVCTVCGEVEDYEPETVKDWFRYQDSTEHKAAPYKYSRTTHFRNSLDRILGNSRVDRGIVERARLLLKGYPDDHACMLTILRQAKMPYQQTASIRRALGYSVPELTAREKRDINNLFEYFCVRYEMIKPKDRKNLPSIEYMIYRFLLHLGRDDVFVRKSSLTPAKQKETDDLIDRILKDFELQELH